MKKLILALIVGATAMAAAQAQTVTQPRGYVGIGVASAQNENVSRGDSYKGSGKIFGGYEVNQNWAVEAGYTDFRGWSQDYILNNAQGTIVSEGDAIYLAGKFSAPVSERTAVYGKLGATRVKAEQSATDPRFNYSEHKTALYAAVGAEYKLNQQVALALEYERYGKSRNLGPKPDVWTVAAKYSF